ncbi:hypothetical protein P7B02_16235 [Caulobacter segnis]|uniref:hypothetical protein n=1 Tax=Caulobacter segnis TaxID=88688 RepID=UPI00240F5F7B|nr:hypothetical protein [Caulobacter segnis]MDG2523083.1 hypothetical protein [Caulobacter segnis]
MTIRKTILSAALLTVIAAPAFAAPHERNAFIHDYDANHDGEVTQAEFDAGRTARFKATDTNGDGWVSEAEYLAEYEVRLDAKLAKSDAPAEDKLAIRQREVRQTHVRFGALDKDKDAKMTKAEYDASGARAFAQQDKDKNGKITNADAVVEKAEATTKPAAN